jgi:hypothetical protein
VFAAAAAVGFAAARPLAPVRLRAEVEQRLSDLLGGEVRVGELRVSLGLGLRLEGKGVVAWPAPGGPALRVERVVAGLRVFSHLTGQHRLRLIRLEGAHLTVERSAAGQWTPPPAQGLAEASSSRREGEGAQSEWLSPLIAAETLARALLERAVVADRFEIRDGAIELRVGDAHRLAFTGIQARLAERAFLGDTKLELRARIEGGDGPLGSFEWEGRRARGGDLRLAVAATDLELAATAPFLRRALPGAELSGRLSGALAFSAPAPGTGHLEVDLVAHRLDSRAPGHANRLQAERAEIGGVLAITPDQVRLEGGRLRSDDLALELDGTLARPLHASSLAEVSLALRDVRVREVRHLIAWLPEVRREEAEALLAPIESGHLTVLRTGGTATLSGWQGFLAGRTRRLPSHFVVDAQLADASLRVGRGDHLESLSGRIWWTGDRIEVRGARARYNQSPLPQLDLTLDGVSHLFASDPAARALVAGAKPLAGLRALWLALRGEPGGPRRPLPTATLEIDRLEHPMFVWPIADASVRLEPVDRGVRLEVPSGRLAGVPVRGEGHWLFEPREMVRVQLQASAPSGPRTVEPVAEGWARGRLELGPVASERWRHEHASGHFLAVGGEFRVADAQVALTPHGLLRASGSLELSRADAVPFEFDFSIEGGDVPALAGVAGLPPTLATGRLAAAGSLAGVLDPNAPVTRSLSGQLEIEIADGVIRREIPAVVAIALASEVFNPFARREEARFDRIHTLLEVSNGRLSTDALELDGPDVRAFASGGVDIASAPHATDVQVALFLFRPVDAVLDKIPIVNLLLLGRNNNLVAAHFALTGPWKQPDARLVPLRSFASGPGSLVFETMPDLVRRGLRALDGRSEPAS